MNETKPWYQSRTVWASIVTIVIACCGLSGAPLDTLDEAVVHRCAVAARNRNRRCRRPDWPPVCADADRVRLGGSA